AAFHLFGADRIRTVPHAVRPVALGHRSPDVQHAGGRTRAAQTVPPRMNAIGGFLPLEVPRRPAAPPAGSAPYHASGVALASGRACWHAVLRACRPRRALVPFYICDAVLQPLIATGTPFDFYALDAAFRPAADAQPAAGELMLVVNYFGVQTPLVAAAVERHADRIVVDDTQAFFRRGSADAWSFNSARKFFG